MSETVSIHSFFLFLHYAPLRNSPMLASCSKIHDLRSTSRESKVHCVPFIPRLFTRKGACDGGRGLSLSFITPDQWHMSRHLLQMDRWMKHRWTDGRENRWDHVQPALPGSTPPHPLHTHRGTLEGHGCLWMCLCELETSAEPPCSASIKQQLLSPCFIFYTPWASAVHIPWLTACSLVMRRRALRSLRNASLSACYLGGILPLFLIYKRWIQVCLSCW